MVVPLSQSLTLSNGNKMPVFGLGTWQSADGEAEAAVRCALDNGYRLIDTAKCYENESEIGNVLQEYFKSGKLKREEVFITTKLWCTHNRKEEVESELRDSLKRLQIDYVDLYLIHSPTCFDHEMKEHDVSVKVEDIWKGMEDVYEKGLTKAIGVSNFSNEQIERIMKNAKIPIHNSQVEAYLYWPQFEHQKVCNKYNITVTAYAPIGSPGRFNFKLCQFEEGKEALSDEVALKLAKKYNKTTAQILLRHLIQRNFSVIPKSSNPQRIIENSKIFDFNLTNEEVEELNNVTYRQRLFKQEFMIGHPEDGFISER
ncbi:Alcohol dehydrogenase [NADP(+)] [Strongyloides ratti]|uniref:Alcohol dehydrogenase [NADP(+)] n=1 Tax=Strongyloides ratti TaxID=34506 RepID=A0A090LIW1_STRRB|nr:Alcohol dehydrogenase [NADP(+)] [Strongyloides ratti]CEF69673.1 Alcohol dehydrogenase [NADP(+)] [Strongyloides ratti]